MSLVGGVLLWKGMNNILAVWTIPSSLERDVTYAAVGLFLILITNTVSYSTGTSLPDPHMLGNRGTNLGMFGAGMAPIVLQDGARDWKVTLFLYGRALFILVAGFIFWTGAWNLLSDFLYHSTILREVLYLGIGLMLLIFTDSLIDQASVSPIALIRASRPHSP